MNRNRGETSAYDIGLGRNAANYQPLTPLKHLERAAAVFPDHVAIIHGRQRVTYAEFWRRSRKLASALDKAGIGKGDTVSVMLSNTPPMLEAHYGVPMTGAVLHSINTRLDAAIIAFQLDHADAKVVIVDREFSAVMAEALAMAEVSPLVIDYDDPDYPRRCAAPEGRAHRQRSTTRTSSPRGDPAISPGACRTTNGTRSRSTTRRARPATRRASSTTIAAPR